MPVQEEDYLARFLMEDRHFILKLNFFMKPNTATNDLEVCEND